MNDTRGNDEELERLLRGSGVVPVANEGFSERVMSVLPARRRSARVVQGVAALGGTLSAAWQMSGAELLHAVTYEIQRGEIGIAGIAVLATIMTLSAILTGWALADR